MEFVFSSRFCLNVENVNESGTELKLFVLIIYRLYHYSLHFKN